MAGKSAVRSLRLLLPTVLVSAVVFWPADAPASQAGTLTSIPSAARTAPANGSVFATLRIPRFGAEYGQPIGEGIGEAAVLN
ncbi:hypothetical protein ACLRGF_11045 [Mycetocola zhadangensis]|uniref:hypothetical protein n=1 Tax=Mycetocola zhadangensis TaxID=1164595 RepID=UPI003A4D885A